MFSTLRDHTDTQQENPSLHNQSLSISSELDQNLNRNSEDGIGDEAEEDSSRHGESRNKQVKRRRRFLGGILLEVSTSEPRDALQSERTCLVFIRFASTLFFSGFGVMLNFKLNSSDLGNSRDRDTNSVYKKVIVFIIFALSSATFVLSGVNHLVTMNRYAQHKIETYSFSNIATIICMSCIALTLVSINVTLIVFEYLDI